MTLFLRLLDAPIEEKGDALRGAIATLRETRNVDGDSVFEREPSVFSAVARSPFAYWVPDGIRRVFRILRPLESAGRYARLGAHGSQDFRWVRCWWEPKQLHHGLGTWAGFAKGGSFSRFYSDVHLIVDWEPRRRTFLGFLGRPGREIEKPESVDYFFRPGLTWPLRTQIGFGMRAMPSGCIFGHKGPVAFTADDSPTELLALLAITTSTAFCYLVELQMAFGSYEVGVIQRTPVPELTESDTEVLSKLARCAWSLKRSLDTVNETSHAFLLPDGINQRVTGLDPAAVQRELGEIQAQIDDHAFRLYGIKDADRAAIEASSKRPTSSDAEDSDESDDDENPLLTAEADTLFSWLVGVAFGRFDPRLATRKRPIPPEPEPFDPLPARSPGMWPEGEESMFVPPDILVDDPGHDDDLRARVANSAANTGVPDPDDLRQWLAKQFFPLHIKMYSKSRRKAPIYWQLATPSASYSVWLYIHAFTPDTFFRVQNDYVAPKLALEERRLETLSTELGDKPSAAQRKQLAAQEAFVEELRAFLAEVKLVTPLWNPDLDDGVLINFAPLWRLVPQHRAWQRELKATWDALREGKYDWSHLAMHLWPEQVIPKCATDRSLAIAHGLEAIFWEEGSDGKWSPRETPTRSVEQLTSERSSPEKRAALKHLLEAPAPAGAARSRGRGKA